MEEYSFPDEISILLIHTRVSTFLASADAITLSSKNKLGFGFSVEITATSWDTFATAGLINTFFRV